MLTLMLVAVLGGDPLDKMPADQVAAILREYEVCRDADLIAAKETLKNPGASRRDKTVAQMTLLRGEKVKPGYKVFVPTIRDLRRGAVGGFGEHSKGFKVLRIIDADSAAFLFNEEKQTPFVVKGIETNGLSVDSLEKISGEYRVTGVQEYKDDNGETHSAPVVEAFALREFLSKHHPIYSQSAPPEKQGIKPKKKRAN